MSSMTPLAAFVLLNQRKRLEPEGLSEEEKQIWRSLRCELEGELFEQVRDPTLDQRDSLRVPVIWQVKTYCDQGTAAGFLTVLGESGCYISTPQNVSVGSPVQLEMTPSDGGNPFRVKGVVVWSRPEEPPPGDRPEVEQGIGVRFVDLLPHQRQRIYEQVDNVLQRSFQENRFALQLVNLSLEVSQGERVARPEVFDIAREGMMLACDLDYPVGSQVKFDLTVPDKPPLLTGRAEIIAREDGASLGARFSYRVRFVDLDGDSHQILLGFSPAEGAPR